MSVLVLNSGSSSLKFQLIATDRERIQKNADERICRESGTHWRRGDCYGESEKSPRQKFTAPLANLSAALDYLIRWIASEESGISQVQSAADIHAVDIVWSRRQMFAESAIITDEVLKGIEDCIDLAPLHNPQHQVHSGCAPNPGAENSAGRRLRHGIHHSCRSRLLVCLALPFVPPHHIRRYGFHGTSHRYVAYRIGFCAT